MDEEGKVYDLLILGGGPAGLTAAIYAGRSKLSVLVIERGAFGGAVFETKSLVNYPGILPGETGREFSARLEEQAWSFGAERLTGEARSVGLAGDIKEVVIGDAVYRGKALIIATGRAVNAPTQLGIPGEKEYTGRGVSYCAICDGPFFSGRDVFVVGGGDSALEESLYLAKVTRHVTVIHREDAFQASGRLIEMAEGFGNISFMLDTAVTEIGGGELVTEIKTENLKTGEKKGITAEQGENFGVFIYVGMRPTTEVLGNDLDMNDGYIITDEEMRTNIKGVFAAGDVRYKKYRQAVMAASDGATAALFAEKYILEEK